MRGLVIVAVRPRRAVNMNDMELFLVYFINKSLFKAKKLKFLSVFSLTGDLLLVKRVVPFLLPF